MKIRLYQNSLRLRLSPSEVDELAKGESISEIFHWGNTQESTLIFKLIPHDENVLDCSSDRSTWKVHWKRDAIENWAGSEEVGMYSGNDDNGSMIKVSIEKDFACIGRENEDKNDRFPNPNANSC